jgi:hypothetical protein
MEKKYVRHSVTVNVHRTSKRAREWFARQAPDDGKRRLPLTRAECDQIPRPCPYVSCRHHLYLDVTRFGSIRLNFPTLQPHELVDSCSLDVADRGSHSLEECGPLLNITKERVRQLELELMARLEARRGDLE